MQRTHIESAAIVLACFLSIDVQTSTGQDLKDAPPCNSSIYCNGPLLDAAQKAWLYNESKTFVDLHMKQPEDVILAAFGAISDPSDQTMMRQFVDEYFDGPNTEFTTWKPSDWKENPIFLAKIKDENLRQWASDLNDLWKELGRQIKLDVATNSDRYSLMYVEQPFVVPGGRFREFYYWDSYWIFKGLLLSEMTDTVKDMLTNFISMTKSLGHVPNGNRVYYQRRSQPPFLIPSVYLYAIATDDTDFVSSVLPDLEREYRFWMDERSIVLTKPDTSKNYTLNQYNVFMGMPRPEAYREDIETADGLDEVAAAEVYSNLASAAESGWDFSSRWFGPELDLSSIRTKEIVPVDLNSILCMSERALMELFNLTGNYNKAGEYQQALEDRKEAIEEIFWDETAGVWLDYDLVSKSTIDKFYVSNIAPMWAKCYGDGTNNRDIEQNVLDYLKAKGVLNYPGGVPTSLTITGQQWDYPNAWAPLQDIIIDALRQSDLEEAQDYALNLANNWTLTNWLAYDETGLMFEKYDVEKQGVPGHGGEYIVQAGFGWTNGVIMTILDHYGDVLEIEPSSASSVAVPMGLHIVSILLIWVFRGF